MAESPGEDSSAHFKFMGLSTTVIILDYSIRGLGVTGFLISILLSLNLLWAFFKEYDNLETFLEGNQFESLMGAFLLLVLGTVPFWFVGHLKSIDISSLGRSWVSCYLLCYYSLGKLVPLG